MILCNSNLEVNVNRTVAGVEMAELIPLIPSVRLRSTSFNASTTSKILCSFLSPTPVSHPIERFSIS